MSRLVDADELMWRKSSLVEPRDKAVSMGKPFSDDEVYAYRLGWNDAIDSIMEYAPTVDAVEVVRCKDCKYYLNSNEKCGLIDTRLHFYETDKTWTEDCFCSWGERREDDNK